MPSWLSGVVEHSLLERFQEFRRVATTSLSEWDNLETRAQRAMDAEFDRLKAAAGDDADDDSLLNQASFASDEFIESMLPLAQSMLNLFTLGLHHLFEQQLIDFVRTMNATPEVSSTTPSLIVELSA